MAELLSPSSLDLSSGQGVRLSRLLGPLEGGPFVAHPVGGGHSSTLVRLDLPGGEPVAVVKLCDGVATKVLAESAALELLAAQGFAAAPRVWGSGTGTKAAGLVLSWLGGRGARTLDAARDAIDAATVGAALGQWLARLHEVRVPVGAVRFSDDPLPWGRRVQHQAEQARRRLLRRSDLAPEVVALSVVALDSVVADAEVWLTEPRPGRLIHRDLRGANIVLDGDGGFAGVVDFERAGAGDPAWDFAKLRWWVLDAHPGLEAPLTAAYRAVRPVPCEERRRLYRRFEAATMVAWFGAGHPVYLRECVAQLRAELRGGGPVPWCVELR